MKWKCGCSIKGQSIKECEEHRTEYSFENLKYGLPEERELEENLK